MIEEVRPPAWALRFLRTICPEHLREEIEGDLVQRFERDVKRQGLSIARKKFTRNVLRFFRPGILLRNSVSIQLTEFFMIRNYFKIAFRNFYKQRSFTLLNVIGLSLGMVASMLI